MCLLVLGNGFGRQVLLALNCPHRGVAFNIWRYIWSLDQFSIVVIHMTISLLDYWDWWNGITHHFWHEGLWVAHEVLKFQMVVMTGIGIHDGVSYLCSHSAYFNSQWSPFAKIDSAIAQECLSGVHNVGSWGGALLEMVHAKLAFGFFVDCPFHVINTPMISFIIDFLGLWLVKVGATLFQASFTLWSFLSLPFFLFFLILPSLFSCNLQP